MNPVSSMTGFATSAGEGFTLTIKSVNHRFLDLQVRTPSGYESIEALLRTAVREAVRRGHVEVSLHIETSQAGAMSLQRNDTLLAALVKTFRESAAEHGLAGEPDLNMLLRMPGVIVSEIARISLPPEEVAATTTTLIGRFLAARAIEGSALAREMHGAMDRLLDLTEQMASLRLGVREAHLLRLRARLLELVDGHDVPEERLLTEAALLLDRSDVEEEIVRMRTHARQFQAVIDAGGEIGKRLDFLLQEMNREANTMVSKVNGAMGERGLSLTDIGLAMKVEIERVKEQVQNIE